MVKENKREAQRQRDDARGGINVSERMQKRKKGDVVNENKHGGEMKKPVVSRVAAGLMPA